MKISRQYLLGLGSGLILSALLALIYTPFVTKSTSTAGATATEATAAAASSSATDSPTVSSPAGTSSASTAQVSSSSGKLAPENLTQAKRNFVIPSGASADKIAQLLQDGGWIQKKEDFLAMTKAKKLENRFKVGTFELSPGLSIEEVINQLIR